MLTNIKKGVFAVVPVALAVAGTLGAVACGGLPPEEGEAVGEVESSIVVGTGNYNLVGLQSGKCLQIRGGSTASAARLEIAPCDGSAKQQFRAESMGSGFYRLRNVNSNLCVDVSGASTSNGAAVIQYACGSGFNQQWSFTDVTGGERIIARHSGKVLDVTGASTADGALLTQWSSNGGTNQVFKLQTPPGPTDPYAPRSGTFKMLVYSKTQAFRHASISAGVSLLRTLATEKGFSVVTTETNENFTSSGLAGFEIVVFMNTTGDVLDDAEQTAFQTWMTTKNGAWIGVHAAADTEPSWPWYHELDGQPYTMHSPSGTPNQVAFDPKYATHPAVRGLPNPWTLTEEWYNFSEYLSWQDKPGFQILGRKITDNQPIIWARQTDNYRSFYFGLGHEPATFSNADVKKMFTGAILWAVRREHLL